jgi:Tol biopolymer transport system component
MRTTITLATALLLAACTWSPAEAKIAGTNGQILFAHNDPSLRDSMITTVDADGGQATPLHLGEEARWSPDGSQIAFLTCLDPPECHTAAAIMDVGTGAIRGIAMPQPDSLFIGCAVWSPDAQRLACGASGQSDPGLNGIYTIRASDGGDLERVTSNPGGEDIPGDFSPDGTQLVFLRSDPARPQANNGAIFVVSLDGAGLHRVSPWGHRGIGIKAGWSPDGSKIVFSKSGSLFTVRPDGSDLTKIPLVGLDGRAFAFDPSWSPDGSKIVFPMLTWLRPRTPAINIFTAHADGTGLTQLTHATSLDNVNDSPDWGAHPSSG